MDLPLRALSAGFLAVCWVRRRQECLPTCKGKFSRVNLANTRRDGKLMICVNWTVSQITSEHPTAQALCDAMSTTREKLKVKGFATIPKQGDERKDRRIGKHYRTGLPCLPFSLRCLVAFLPQQVYQQCPYSDVAHQSSDVADKPAREGTPQGPHRYRQSRQASSVTMLTMRISFRCLLGS